MGVDDEQRSPASSHGSPEKSLGSKIVLDVSDSDEGDTEGTVSNRNSNENLSLEEFDKNIPNTVQLLTTPNGSKIYLVGTVHFSRESQEDVSKVIQNVKPHVVMVELCPDRTCILSLDEESIEREAKNISFEKIRSLVKENGLIQGLMNILILNSSATLTKEFGMAPGGEFRRAFAEVQKLGNCIIQFGDRPIGITLRRALSQLSWWKTIHVIWSLIFNDEKISKEDLEKWKQGDMLDSILAQLAEDFPELSLAFSEERDIFLTYSLQVAADTPPNMLRNRNHMVQVRDEPLRIVGIVGIGHVPGIVRNWLKVTDDMIAPLMTVPPRSRSSKIMGMTFKVAGVGLLCWGCYKLIPKTVTNAIHSFSVSYLFSPLKSVGGQTITRLRY